MPALRVSATNLTARHTLWAGLSGLLGVLLASIVWVDAPLVRRLGHEWSRVHALQAQVAEAREMERERVTYDARFQQTQAELGAIKTHVGNAQGIAKTLETLRKHAVNHHVELMVTQLPSEDDAHVLEIGPHLTLHEVPLTLRVQGRYRSLGAFLGTLSSLPFVSHVQECAIQPVADEAAKLKGTVQLAVYVLKGPSS